MQGISVANRNEMDVTTTFFFFSFFSFFQAANKHRIHTRKMTGMPLDVLIFQVVMKLFLKRTQARGWR